MRARPTRAKTHRKHPLQETENMARKFVRQHPVTERRASPRQDPAALPALKSVGFTDGREVRLINISRGGALLESEVVLRPGLSVCIRVVAADAVFVLRGKVQRSCVSALRGPVAHYQSAVEFEQEFSLLGDVEAGSKDGAKPAISSDPEDPAPPSKPVGCPTTAEDSRSDISTITVALPQTGPDLRQIFGLNRW